MSETPKSKLNPLRYVVEARRLSARVAELEDAVRECRRQHHRVAELTDVVQELLLPLSQRDDEKVAEILERYTDQLG